MTVKDLLFESNLSCYETKYRLKDQAFRQLNLMGKDIFRKKKFNTKSTHFQNLTMKG